MNGSVARSRWRRTLAEWLRPPRTLRITRTGRTFLVLTLGIGLGALNTGNNLLYLVLGLQLGMIVVSGVLSERALRGLTVRRLGTDSAFAGEPFAFRWALAAGKTPAFAITVSEVGDGLHGSGAIGYLPRATEQVVRGELTAAARGPHALRAVRVTTEWPFGLFAKSRELDLEGLLLVYPRRGFSCGDPEALGNGPLGDRGDPRQRDGAGDLLGLRELGENEDARRVHWLKSAAAGKLLRTEREREHRESYLLRVPGGLAAAALDRKCEELSALGQWLISDGHDVGLEVEDVRIRPATGPAQTRRLLEALAWAGFARPISRRSERKARP